jgi:hypothetical protein
MLYKSLTSTTHVLVMSGYVRCVADPIHAPASGYADEFNGRSIALKIRQSFPITCNSDGNAASLIQPQLNLMHRYANLAASFKSIRIVSMAVQVTYTGSNDTAKGEVIMVGTQGLATGDLSTLTSDWRDYQGAVSHAVKDLKGPMTGSFHAFDRVNFNIPPTNFTSQFPCCFICVNSALTNDTAFRID